MYLDRLKTDNILLELQKLYPPMATIEADGQVHRFGRHKNMWYVANWNRTRRGIPILYCTIGDWSTGEKAHFYQLDTGGRPMLSTSWKPKEKIEAEFQEISQHFVAKRNFERDYAGLSTRGRSAYLERKGIESVLHYTGDSIRFTESHFTIPLVDAAGIYWGGQRIYHDGTKRFYIGQRIRECHYVLRHSSGPEGVSGSRKQTRLRLYCEGFSTGATLLLSGIQLAEHVEVVVCFNAGNLHDVGLALQANWERDLSCTELVAGDDDWMNTRTRNGIQEPYNVGQEKATELAQLLGCQIVFPVFKEREGRNTTDFNDLHVREGLEVVTEQLRTAYGLASLP